MMERFNLLFSPWIGVIDDDGSKYVSVMDIIKNEYDDLSFPKTEMDGICYVFLINLFQTYVLHGGEVDDFDGFEDFLNSIKDYFYLEDEVYPFMQGNFGASEKIRNVKIGRLFPASFGRNAGVMYSGFHECEYNLCEKCVSPGLLLYQWTSAKEGGQKSPILGSGSAFFVRKSNKLLNTLSNNSLDKKTFINKYGPINELTGFMWVDKNNPSFSTPLQQGKNNGMYSMWSQCRNIKLNGNISTCSFCGSNNVKCFSSFDIGNKFCNNELTVDKNPWSHPLNVSYLNKDKEQLIKCKKFSSFSSYDKYSIFVSLKYDGNLLNDMNIDDSLLCFGIFHENNFSEIIYVDVPITKFDIGRKLYKISNGIFVSMITKIKQNKDRNYQNEDFKREYFSLTEKEFNRCLKMKNENMASGKFATFCINVAIDMFEKYCLYNINSSSDKKEFNYKKYVGLWTQLLLRGENVFDLDRVKKELIYNNKKIDDFNKYLKHRKELDFVKSDFEIWRTPFSPLLNEIGEKYKVDIYKYGNSICDLLKILEHDDDIIFPAQIGDIIKEHKFLNLLETNYKTDGDIDLFIQIIKECLGKTKQRLFKTNVNVLLGFLFNYDRLNKTKRASKLKHIWASCYYSGIKREEENENR